MKRAEVVMAVVLGLFSIYLMWKSTELNVGYVRGEGPGGGAWPFWLSGIMLLCTLVILFNAFKGKTVPSQSEEPLLDRFGKRMLLQVGGGIFGFVALIDIISIYGAICVFLLYYLGFLGRHSWRFTLGMAIVTPIVIFFFFEGLMRISLPKGLPFLDPIFNVLFDLIY